jgi:hypothetical protein
VNVAENQLLRIGNAGLITVRKIEHWNNEVQVNIDEITACSVGEGAAAIYSSKSAE